MRYVTETTTAITINDQHEQFQNVVLADSFIGCYGEWTIKNVKLTTNGEFTCMAVNNNGRMMQPVSGQFVIMELTVMAAIMARVLR